jgi:CheY-like chemotaxis protein
VKDCGSYIKKSRVLLVDDEPDIVYLVKTRLERNGFEVDAYTDPLLALQNFKGGLYLLLVLDIKMPKMDGIELFNRIEKADNKSKFAFSQHQSISHPIIKICSKTLQINFCLYQNQYQFLK